jgi:hypothetical protein
MKPTIRERGQKVFQIVKEKSVTGVAAIAAATGIAKSSVHRHQQSIGSRRESPLIPSQQSPIPNENQNHRPRSQGNFDRHQNIQNGDNATANQVSHGAVGQFQPS